MRNKGGNYDPFSYGEVRLAPGTTDKPQAADAPEDLLFASPPSSAPQVDAGWEPLPAQVDLITAVQPRTAPAGQPQDRTAAGPGPAGAQSPFGSGLDFGADVLNEKGGAPAMPAAKPRPSTHLSSLQAMRQELAAIHPPSGGQSEAARQQSPIVKEKIIGALPVQRIQVPRHTGSLALPAIVFAAGLAGGGWFWLVQHNAILGGFAAAIGVVGSAFAWIHVRR